LVSHFFASTPMQSVLPSAATVTFPPPLSASCLRVGARPPDLVPYPATVLLGGRQLIKVDLATDALTPVGPCRTPEKDQWILPMRGVRVVVTEAMHRRIMLTDGSGYTTDLSPGSFAGAVVARGRHLLVAQQLRRTKASITYRLSSYTTSGWLTSRVTATAASSGRVGRLVGLYGIKLIADTRAGVLAYLDDALVLLNPATGKVTRTIGRNVAALGVGSNELAWESGAPLTWARGQPHGFMECTTTCPPLKVTNLRSWQTVNYPEPASAHLFRSATFSPNGRLVALAADHVPVGTVTILNLHTGATTVVRIADHYGPQTIAWTPDGNALILTVNTKRSLLLMVWHRRDGSLTTAASLTGEIQSPSTLDVMGRSLDAWR
jgi:hypothetical protein